MGLDTSHNAWHGPYSSFHHWRIAVARASGLSIYERRLQPSGSRPMWIMPDEDDILFVLLNHSDCEGVIEAQDCTPLADRLEGLLPAIVQAEAKEIGYPDWYTTSTTQFIKGLRLAASRNEPIEFH
jgi:hypothetical protein